MAVNRSGNNLSYGLQNALQSLAPQPLIAQRNPTSADVAEIGTLWINEAANSYFILTSGGNWVAQSESSSTVATLDITGASGTVLTVDSGDSQFGGDVAIDGNTVMSGNLLVGGNLVANGDFDLNSNQAITISSSADVIGAVTIQADGGANESVKIQSLQGTDDFSVNLFSNSGGITLETSSSVSNSSIKLDSISGGYQFDAALASQINVTGAGQDLQINTTGGSVKMTATESAIGAIDLAATGVAGTVRVVGAGGVTVSSTNTPMALASGTGAMSIGADATVHTVTVGSATGASSTVIQGGTAGINIGTTANVIPVVIGNATSTTSVAINSGSGGITLTSAGSSDIVMNAADSFDVDAVGSIEINSSTNDIFIGNDDVDHDISIGIAGERVIKIGNDGAGTDITVYAPTISVGSSIDFTSPTSVGIGNIDTDSTVTIDCGPTGSINVGTSIGSIDQDITIGNNSSGSIVTLQAGSNADLRIISKTATNAGFTVTNNAKVGSITLTGQTLASGASQNIVITNSNVTTSSPVLVSISNLNVSGNGASLGIQGTIQAANTLTLNVKNNGGGNLASTDTIIIGFMVLA